MQQGWTCTHSQVQYTRAGLCQRLVAEEPTSGRYLHVLPASANYNGLVPSCAGRGSRDLKPAQQGVETMGPSGCFVLLSCKESIKNDRSWYITAEKHVCKQGITASCFFGGFGSSHCFNHGGVNRTWPQEHKKGESPLIFGRLHWTGGIPGKTW